MLDAQHAEDFAMPRIIGDDGRPDHLPVRYGLPPVVEYVIHRVELCMKACADISVHDLREVAAGTKRLTVVDHDDMK